MNSSGNKILLGLKKIFFFTPKDAHSPNQDKTAGLGAVLESGCCDLPRAQRDMTVVRAAGRPEPSQEKH